MDPIHGHGSAQITDTGHWWRFPGAGPRRRGETRAVPDYFTERSGITMEQSGVYAVLLIVLVIFATCIGSYILDL
jgi:hypothetical protein